MIEFALVMIGGSFGAICRFGVSAAIKRISSIEFPIATLLVNMAGSFLLGILMAIDTGNLIQLLLGMGFLGGFTTFSTFEMENITLFQSKSYRKLLMYISSSCICCILLALFGLQIGGLLS